MPYNDTCLTSARQMDASTRQEAFFSFNRLRENGKMERKAGISPGWI